MWWESQQYSLNGGECSGAGTGCPEEVNLTRYRRWLRCSIRLMPGWHIHHWPLQGRRIQGWRTLPGIAGWGCIGGRIRSRWSWFRQRNLSSWKYSPAGKNKTRSHSKDALVTSGFLSVPLVEARAVEFLESWHNTTSASNTTQQPRCRNEDSYCLGLSWLSRLKNNEHLPKQIKN